MGNNVADKNKQPTITEINQWLSKSFADGLHDSEDMLEHLSIVMEGLCLQGILDDDVFNAVYAKLNETKALLTTMPTPKGWRIKTIWQTDDNLFVEAMAPEIFSSFMDAQIKAGSLDKIQVNSDDVIIASAFDGHEYQLLDRQIIVYSMKCSGNSAVNWLSSQPVSIDNNGLTRINIKDFKNASSTLGKLDHVEDMIMPVFELSSDDKSAIVLAKGAGLLKLEQRFAITQAELVDDLIENSCWSNNSAIARFRGYHGSSDERLAVVRQALVVSEAIQIGVIS